MEITNYRHYMLHCIALRSYKISPFKVIFPPSYNFAKFNLLG